MRKDIEARYEVISGEDHYKRLGLTPQSTLPQVKAAYLLLVKRYHPDRVAMLGLPREVSEKLNRVFGAVQEAYEVLSVPTRREAYDRALGQGSQGKDASARKRAEAEIQFKKGDALMKKKDFRQALTYLQPAVEGDPKNGLYLASLAWAKLNVGPRDAVQDEVRSMLVRVLKAEGGHDRAQYYLGLLARMDGRTTDAEKHFTQAVKLNPNLQEAVTELRILRRRMEHKTDSGSLIRKMLGKD